MAAIASSYRVEDQRRMTAARNYFAWQAAIVRSELGRRVVEVGCGIGNFTASLLDREAVIAVDADPDCVAELERRYHCQVQSHRNLIALCRDAASLGDLARFEPDSCVCLNVLEHIEDDRAALSSMASILPAGGKIVLLLPAFQSLYGPIDRNLGHFRRYDRDSLTRLAGSAGLTARKLRYVNLPGFFAWWINARIFKREAQSAVQIRVFDRYVLPVVARIEQRVNPPFGQSLFAVLVKN